MILQDHRRLSGCIFRVKNATVRFLVRLSRRILRISKLFQRACYNSVFDVFYSYTSKYLFDKIFIS
jgi:hypothetical protein